MNKVIFVPVFYPRSASPSGSVTLDEARLLVREGHAGWVNRCKAIRLLREGYDLRGLSCALRPDRALGNSREIRAAVKDYSVRSLSR